MLQAQCFVVPQPRVTRRRFAVRSAEVFGTYFLSLFRRDFIIER